MWLPPCRRSRSSERWVSQPLAVAAVSASVVLTYGTVHVAIPSFLLLSLVKTTAAPKLASPRGVCRPNSQRAGVYARLPVRARDAPFPPSLLSLKQERVTDHTTHGHLPTFGRIHVPERRSTHSRLIAPS